LGTFKTIWFFAWRMTLSGPLLGTVLGSLYGVFFSLVMILFGAALALDGGQMGAQPAVPDVLGGVALVVMYGVLFGAVLGATVGLTLGVLNGLVLGVLTRAFYYPAPANGRRYQLVSGLVCMAASALACFYVGALARPEAGLGTFFGGRALDLALFVVLPPLVAVAAASVLGVLVTAWWARKSRATRPGQMPAS
jgi:hypothetical protein